MFQWKHCRESRCLKKQAESICNNSGVHPIGRRALVAWRENFLVQATASHLALGLTESSQKSRLFVVELSTRLSIIVHFGLLTVIHTVDKNPSST